MDDIAVRVENASVRFNLGTMKNEGMRGYVRSVVRGEFRFHEFYAVRDLDLTVKKGESWGFIGRNGSGKSTLLKMIAGILKPYKGTVTVNGTLAPLLELGAGFDAELTGRENIYMNGLLIGMRQEDIDANFDSIVEFSELEKFLDVPIKNYSSGMKARLGFAIATTAKPDILIADEVLSTGDSAFQHKCEERMKELRSGGTTLLFVSHSSSAIKRICKNVMWLNHGQVRMSGTTEEVMEAYDLYTNMGLR